MVVATEAETPLMAVDKDLIASMGVADKTATIIAAFITIAAPKVSAPIPAIDTVVESKVAPVGAAVLPAHNQVLNQVLNLDLH